MAKTKKTVETKAERNDDLASDVLSIINKTFKEFPDAGIFLEDANLVPGWISTGCDILDLAISNRPNAGIPLSKILEVSGLEGSGKSLLAATIMAECQKKGGIAVLFDTEGAVGMLDFYRSIGLNLKELVYIDKLRALEEVYEATEKVIDKIISSDKDKPVVIVIDSVNGSSTLKELEEDYLKKGYATDKAIINSLAMRKFPSLLNNRNITIILINQLRVNMNAMGFGADPYCVDPFTTKIKIRYKK